MVLVGPGRARGEADPKHSPARFNAAAIILLSFVLAISFLLVILSCALWSNWLPLFSGKFVSYHHKSQD